MTEIVALRQISLSDRMTSIIGETSTVIMLGDVIDNWQPAASSPTKVTWNDPAVLYKWFGEFKVEVAPSPKL